MKNILNSSYDDFLIKVVFPDLFFFYYVATLQERLCNDDFFFYYVVTLQKRLCNDATLQERLGNDE